MSEWILGLSKVGTFAFLSHVVRYALFAGVAYAVFWLWKRDAWHHRRIQASFPSGARPRGEVKASLTSLAVFAGVGVALIVPARFGYTQLYTDVADVGWTWTIASVPVLLLWHDTYFYWAHRFMHWGPVFKRIHAVHHRSTNPSPWAAFAFHPGEALVEALVIPIAVFVIPLHPGAIFVWFLAMTTMNVIGHLGYETFPSGFTRGRLTRWSNTSSHHNQHHRFVDCNYGLYYNWWDRWMGTNHAEYHERFERVASHRGSASLPDAASAAAR